VTPSEFKAAFAAAKTQVQTVIVGMDDIVEGVLTTLFADGNVLLEGLPGLGKTRLVKTLADALELSSSRIQFTPDLMPADVTGTHLVSTDDRGRKHFSLRKGPIFANIVLADEINRATPKTQSALLEAMQERQVTLLGETSTLPRPFVVVATQNPLEMEGTYPLPEAQLDRFIMQLNLQMPSEEELITILNRTTGMDQTVPEKALGAARIMEMRAVVRAVPAAPETLRLGSRILLYTHPDNPSAPESVKRFVRFGGSPRGVQAMVMAGKVRALVARGDQRMPVLSPEDLAQVAVPCLRHRLILNFEGEAEGIDSDGIVRDAVSAAVKSLEGK